MADRSIFVYHFRLITTTLVTESQRILFLCHCSKILYCILAIAVICTITDRFYEHYVVCTSRQPRKFVGSGCRFVGSRFAIRIPYRHLIFCSVRHCVPCECCRRVFRIGNSQICRRSQLRKSHRRKIHIPGAARRAVPMPVAYSRYQCYIFCAGGQPRKGIRIGCCRISLAVAESYAIARRILHCVPC